MYLMLKDTEVLYFNLEEFVVNVINRELLPLSLRAKIRENNNMQNILYNIQYVKSYLSSRVLSLSRDNAKQLYALFKIPQLNDIDTRVKICLMCKGISIQDSYWVKTDDSNDKFSDINIRQNKFKDIVDIALLGENPSITVNPICPELTTHGLFKKAWIREDTELYLLKSDKHPQNINTRMEVLASKILDCFDNKINCIEYNGRLRNTSEGKIYVDKCKNFVTEQYSFVEAWEAQEYCNDTNQNFIGYIGFSEEVASIAVLDFVIVNTDRHSQNYGFLMDNDTGIICGIAPLFDFNCALVADVFNKKAEDTLSQMFNDGRSLRQVAEQYKPYHSLKLNRDKLTRLKSRYKEYENVFNNVLNRCKIMEIN